jgi:hypothetical protein
MTEGPLAVANAAGSGRASARAEVVAFGAGQVFDGLAADAGQRDDGRSRCFDDRTSGMRQHP